MNDNIINVGDICTYCFDNTNKSLSIVEVVKELSPEYVVVKFHQVIVDDSGNGYFTYLCNNDKTMNVSRKYLNKIDIVNSQKVEIEKWQKVSELAAKEVVELKIELQVMRNAANSYKAECVRLKDLCECMRIGNENT